MHVSVTVASVRLLAQDLIHLTSGLLAPSVWLNVKFGSVNNNQLETNYYNLKYSHRAPVIGSEYGPSHPINLETCLLHYNSERVVKVIRT